MTCMASLSPLQLSYHDILQDGPAISVSYPDTDTPVELLVGQTIETAVKILKPNQSSQGIPLSPHMLLTLSTGNKHGTPYRFVLVANAFNFYTIYSYMKTKTKTKSEA